MIVVGDQSIGKSSVLEALARVRFPVHDQLCTRFPTNFILRRSKERLFHVSIETGTAIKREDVEKERILQFAFSTSDENGLKELITKAAETLGVAYTNKSEDARTAQATQKSNSPNKKGADFSDDVLKIEIHGPELPLLSLVDLPC